MFLPPGTDAGWGQAPEGARQGSCDRPLSSLLRGLVRKYGCCRVTVLVSGTVTNIPHFFLVATL